MTTTAHPPIHPGIVLFEDYMQPMGLSQRRLADLMNVPPRRINEIIHGKRAITPDTSLRLGKMFGISETFWLNMQTHYDLEVAKETTDLSTVKVLEDA
ncbi:HigA family addiction module antitoxin [Williamsia sp. DF01-3]|uniref:HigA family addiction module antitoxin n=1 Tax=Williamsia sp. DF01-3 TaxID=2934157 RepID=UPI001FF58640|nr:HigA family addiction module antitoxin [Williamsia sp. DF01-3]MCK0515627.1 HigA family addiction module antitoxin [Williamsia sp. DF01-3]